MEPAELRPEDLIGPLNEVETKHAPQQLFAAGDITMLRNIPRVSIVGSRKASEDGLRRARRLTKILVERGVVIISGLAEGIDTAAHTSAIDSGGRTAAVLGTPLSESYPKSNRALQARLMQEQLVLSQFPSGSIVRPQNFPIRNRTMALLSNATVIVEAANKSGSLHQGWEALRLGRPLFIAKSIVDNPELSWAPEMLAYGAYVLSDDTLDELFSLLPDPAIADSSDALAF